MNAGGREARSTEAGDAPITVLCGCMFSGKTTELLRRLGHRPPQATVVFKHIIDDRYELDAVVTHGGKAVPAVRISMAREILDHVGKGVELVAVDEGHFFDSSLVQVSQELARRGIAVIITLLDRDSWGRPFPLAEQLCAVAGEPVVGYAVCGQCGAAADRTQRVTPIVDGRMVGGPEHYEPRCQKCWTPPPQ